MERIVIKIKPETAKKFICIQELYFCFSLLHIEDKLS